MPYVRLELPLEASFGFHFGFLAYISHACGVLSPRWCDGASSEDSLARRERLLNKLHGAHAGVWTFHPLRHVASD